MTMQQILLTAIVRSIHSVFCHWW